MSNRAAVLWTNGLIPETKLGNNKAIHNIIFITKQLCSSRRVIILMIVLLVLGQIIRHACLSALQKRSLRNNYNFPIKADK